MALASASSPAWLHTLAQIASVILVLELLVVLLIICALMAGLALGMRWLHEHVVPLVQENAPRAQQAMVLTRQNTDRVVHGVAEFYGRREAARTGLRVLLFGRQAAEHAHEDAQVQAATDLHLISGPESAPRGAGNGVMPRPVVAREDRSQTGDQAYPAARAADASEGRGSDRQEGGDSDNAMAGNAG
jgi:hypothetical protein